MQSSMVRTLMSRNPNLLYYLQHQISLTPAECKQQTANSHNLYESLLAI